MKLIFYSLLLSSLVYVALNLWGHGVGTVDAVDNTVNSIFKNLSSGDSTLGQKSARILFFSKIDQSGAKSSVKVALEEPILVAAADQFTSCLGLGPFGSVISAQDVAERLKVVGYTVEMTAVDKRTGESDYRVVMPPLSSQQEAFRRLRELKSRGIASFVITRGVGAQGISLGVFSSNVAAVDYQHALIDLGYNVLLDVLPRVNRSYWVQITEGMFPEEVLLYVAAEFIDVGVTETGCMN